MRDIGPVGIDIAAHGGTQEAQGRPRTEVSRDHVNHAPAIASGRPRTKTACRNCYGILEVTNTDMIRDSVPSLYMIY